MALRADVRQGGGVEVEIVNEGPEPVRFSTATMIGSVAFEVRDEEGRPVPLGPPPTPPADLEAGALTLAPGESTTLRFRLADLLPGGVPPGRQRIRFAADAPPLGRVESPWVALA